MEVGCLIGISDLPNFKDMGMFESGTCWSSPSPGSPPGCRRMRCVLHWAQVFSVLSFSPVSVVAAWLFSGVKVSKSASRTPPASAVCSMVV